MKHAMTVWVAIVLSLRPAATASEPMMCPNFSPPPVTTAYIAREFTDAVLRLQCGRENGTGFLIDGESGMVLTAAHVVQPAILDPKIKIVGVSPSDPTKTFRLSVAAHLQTDGLDLALLRLDEPRTLEGVVAIDIGTRIPNVATDLYAMGYPRGDAELSGMKADLMKIIPGSGLKARLEVRQSVYPGSSGSPLFDDSGHAVGVCVTRLRDSETVAKYIPMMFAWELLRQVPLGSRTSSLDNQVAKGSITPEQLELRLRPISTNPSNVQLFSWAFRVAENGAERYPKVADYLPCPFSRAAYHRRLDDIADRLSRLSAAGPSSRAEISVSLGRQWAAIGRHDEALAAFRSAARDAAAGDDADLQLAARFGSASVFQRIGEFHAAAIEFDEALGLVEPDSERESALRVRLAEVAALARTPEGAAEVVSASPQWDADAPSYLTSRDLSADPNRRGVVVARRPASDEQFEHPRFGEKTTESEVDAVIIERLDRIEGKLSEIEKRR